MQNEIASLQNKIKGLETKLSPYSMQRQSLKMGELDKKETANFQNNKENTESSSDLK